MVQNITDLNYAFLLLRGILGMKGLTGFVTKYHYGSLILYSYMLVRLPDMALRCFELLCKKIHACFNILGRLKSITKGPDNINFGP